MRGTRTFNAGLLLALVLAIVGGWLWIGHARARDLGRASDVLGYDAAQYAVAARELAEHGRLATPFALPVELARHAHPPWPLSLVQPGLLLTEAALFRVSGTASPTRLGWLVLVIPFTCYLGAAMALGLGTLALLCARETLPAWQRWLAALVVGATLLLDPEAQHYATGGFTELPFTMGLAIAVAWLAAAERPPAFRFGLLLGATGLFRGNMLWLAPVLAAALAYARPTQRTRAFVRAIAGYALVLSPWWLYKWVSFGAPAWDLSMLSLWDGVGGRTWYTLNHLPAMPDVPHGVEAVRALATKFGRNLPALSLQMATGPRTLWIAGLALCLLPGARALGAAPRAAGLAALAMLAMSVAVAAVTQPLLRYVLPVRLVAEAAGLIAVWAYLWRLPEEWTLTPRARLVSCVIVAALAVGWGVRQTARGFSEASAFARDRGVPSAALLREIARDLDRELPPGEPVMSNLGPSLAWYARRPVVHLALTPADIDACRQRLDVKEVVVMFREAPRAWAGWDELMTRPTEAIRHPDWNVQRLRRWSAREGFTIVWLELGPLRPSMAVSAPAR